eukprot:gb/GEZJ01005523.1/.p2 GENE.gb/GEZJ01005523.1/~~gb/GEZJ01005523.1/.p2  ORF type:complete len:117 (-),score=3.70 gb/GEZJ01005523.1/:243-593(-)
MLSVSVTLKYNVQSRKELSYVYATCEKAIQLYFQTHKSKKPFSAASLCRKMRTSLLFHVIWLVPCCSLQCCGFATSPFEHAASALPHPAPMRGSYLKPLDSGPATCFIPPPTQSVT